MQIAKVKDDSNYMAAQSDFFPVEQVRSRFPSIQEDFVFLDNAGGAQVPQNVLDAVKHHLLEINVQRGGHYRHSEAVDASLDKARSSVAVLVGAERPEEIAFGLNATSFIRLVSLGIGQMLNGRTDIIVTELDHAANIDTWLFLERYGVTIKWWKVRQDGDLYLEDLEAILSSNTRLVACTFASNALGTIVDIAAVSERAHSVGAQVFVDAVHFSPHGRIDVQALGCDYLVCSGYKMFAPHMGFLWGRYDLLCELPTFREDFIPDRPPTKIEAGTLPFENIAGMGAAVEYLADLGASLAAGEGRKTPISLAEKLDRAMLGIRNYEQELSKALMEALEGVGARIYGVSDPAETARRVPTFCFNLAGVAPSAVTTAMAGAEIGVRDGHLYTPRLMKRLGLEVETGAVRISLVHYNTLSDIHRFASALETLQVRAG